MSKVSRRTFLQAGVGAALALPVVVPDRQTAQPYHYRIDLFLAKQGGGISILRLR